jgi:hypothetical protein
MVVVVVIVCICCRSMEAPTYAPAPAADNITIASKTTETKRRSL